MFMPGDRDYYFCMSCGERLDKNPFFTEDNGLCPFCGNLVNGKTN